MIFEINYDKKSKIMVIMISDSHEMKAFQGFVLYFSNFKVFPGFSRFSRFSRSAGNPAKWSNTQIIRRQLPPHFLNVSDHFVGLALIMLTLWPVWITIVTVQHEEHQIRTKNRLLLTSSLSDFYIVVYRALFCALLRYIFSGRKSKN